MPRHDLWGRCMGDAGMNFAWGRAGVYFERINDFLYQVNEKTCSYYGGPVLPVLEVVELDNGKAVARDEYDADFWSPSAAARNFAGRQKA